MGTPFIGGRDFSAADGEARPRVAVINASMAAAYFGRENPIGRRLRMGAGAESRSVEVIGIVRDSVYQRLQEEPRRVVYVPYMQTPDVLKASNLYADIRAADPGSIGEALRTTVRSLDASAPIRIETVRGRIDESLVQERLVTVIAAFLGGVSLLLACGALGGLMSHMVASRTSEIGLRIALGAERHAVTALVMREALALSVAGAVAGIGLALAGPHRGGGPPRPAADRSRGRSHRGGHHAPHRDGDWLPARAPRRSYRSDPGATGGMTRATRR